MECDDGHNQGSNVHGQSINQEMSSIQCKSISENKIQEKQLKCNHFLYNVVSFEFKDRRLRLFLFLANVITKSWGFCYFLGSSWSAVVHHESVTGDDPVAAPELRDGRRGQLTEIYLVQSLPQTLVSFCC
jgi:hypothetical protein